MCRNSLILGRIKGFTYLGFTVRLELDKLLITFNLRISDLKRHLLKR